MSDFSRFSNYDSNASFSMVRWSGDSPVLEIELNEMQQILAEARASIVRESINSGVIDFKASDSSSVPQAPGVLIPSPSAFAPSWFNTFGFGYLGMPCFVNGYSVNVESCSKGSNSSLGDGNSDWNYIQLDAPPDSDVTPSLPGSARDDLVFLEMWFQEVGPANNPENVDSTVYTYGGVNGGTETNNIEDIDIQIETTHRVQIRWRIRTVDGVDFASLPEGLGTYWNGTITVSACQAQTGLATPLSYADNLDIGTYSFRWKGNIDVKSGSSVGIVLNGSVPFVTDSGVYVAGDGSTSAKTTLKTVDGYSYAIPLFRVRRRNTGAYNPDTNTHGGATCSTCTFSYTACTFQQTQTVTLTAGNANNYQVGTTLINATSNLEAWQVTAIQSATSMTVRLIFAGGTQGATYSYYNRSDRPDGLFNNIIDASDIVDLRHQVSLTGFNYQALMEKNLDLLLRGQLITDRNQMYARDYIGLNLSSYVDDANTVLFANLDNTINGTSNGVAVTGIVGGGGSGSLIYQNGMSGLSVTTSSGGNVVPYWNQSTGKTITFEGFVRLSAAASINMSQSIFYTAQSTGGGGNTPLLVTFYNGTIFMYVHDTTNNNLVSLSIPINWSVNDSWHYVKATADGISTATLQVDEVSVSGAYNPATQNVGASIVLNSLGVQFDSIRVSSIVRNGSPLPSSFSFAKGDRIMGGPYSDFSFWSDDVGGTAGANSRANPWGLSNVPNQQAARVSYNGSEIKHFYGIGATAGWTSASAINSGSWGITPSGGIDGNMETVNHLLPNESVDGVRTTFTFNKPLSATGMFTTGTQDVGTANATLSSMTYNSGTGVITVVFASAPTSGSLIYVNWGQSQRHVHFVPATKGFVVHDWTDDTFTGNGTATTFQTTKYNVTSVNHIRNASGIMNGGYTVQGLSVTGFLYASAASGATAIVVTGGLPAAVFVGQKLRISDGLGGWVFTTITGASTNVTGGVSYPVSALPNTVPANAIVQGAAQVTFTTAPANGNALDIVYESVVTPALGDYIRISYQRAPYQGLSTRLNSKTVSIVDESKSIFVLSRGTGKLPTDNNASYAQGMTTRLPISGLIDSQFKLDSVTPTGIASWEYWQSNDNAMYPIISRYGSQMHSLLGIVGQTFNMSTSGRAINPGRGFNNLPAITPSAVVGIMGVQVSASVPHMSVWTCVVADNATGELLLLVMTRCSSDNLVIVSEDDTANFSMDFYTMQGKPLIKDYVGVTN